jgi:hypothetical protein
MPENFRQIAPATPENVEIARMWIALELLLDLKREPLHAAHVCVSARDPHPAARGK